MTSRTFVGDARRYLSDHRGLVLTLFFGVLAPLWLFWKVWEDVYKKGGFRADRAILAALHERSSSGMDAAMLAFTLVGGPVIMVAVGVAITLALVALRRRGEALFFAAAAGGAAALNVLVKLVVGRARPDLWVSLAPEGDPSFPSGHAMGTAAVVAALVLLAWRTQWRWPLLLLGAAFVLLVGASRLYLGVHYPSDVLAGWSAAVAWVVGVHQVAAGRARRRSARA